MTSSTHALKEAGHWVYPLNTEAKTVGGEFDDYFPTHLLDRLFVGWRISSGPEQNLGLNTQTVLGLYLTPRAGDQPADRKTKRFV
jgi:hypothetical protein